MGLDITGLMALMTGGGNLMGQAGNLAAQGMGMADTMWDAARYFQRNSDPTINDIRNYNVNRFNSNQYGPYGDIEGSFGGMFGTRADGSPVQFGDMAAAQTNYMLNNNPAASALAQLQAASNMQRPTMPTGIDLMSGDASRAGTGYPPRQATPTAPPSTTMASPVMPSTTLSGVASPSGPNPTISPPTPGPGSAVRQSISDLRSGVAPTGQLPQLPGGGQGMGMAQNWVQQRGGLPALLQAMRQPGNAMVNLRDFAGFGRPGPANSGGGGGGSNPYADFWNTHGSGQGSRNPRMPSYAVGTPYVPQTGPAMLHQGEAVIPRQMNPNSPQQAGSPYLPQRPMNTGYQMPQRQMPQYDPNRGLPPGAQSFGGGAPQMGRPAPTMQPSTAPLPQRPMPMPVQQNPPYQRPIQSIRPFKPDPHAKLPVNPLQAQAQMAQANPIQPLQSSVVPNGGKGGGKKGKKGQGQGASSAPVDPNAKLPVPQAGGQGGGVSGGVSGTTPGTSQGEQGQQTQGPAPIDAGRVNVVQGLLNNPESMSQEWQRIANQQIADTYDAGNADLRRQLQERMAANGLGDSGILQDQLFRGDLARQATLAGEGRNIAQQAALTNFNDRQQVANLALAHQLGIGNLGLQNAQFQNQMYNQDRQYNLQYANALAGLGGQAQQQQSGLLGQLGGLIGSGLGYNDQLLNLIYGQGMQRYADPNVSAVPMTGYAPNPYLDFLASQNQNQGGDSSGMWGAMGAALGGLAGNPAVFGG